MFWVVGISIFIVAVTFNWWYQRNLNWQVKFLRARLNKKIGCQKGECQKEGPLLKNIYSVVNKGMARDDSAIVYQAVDLLKLAFGYGLVRSGESAHLMAIGIVALNRHKPDVASFVIDAFRPLIRQLSPADVVVAVNQLTLIGVVSLKKKQNFLAAKVVDSVLLIMEQTDAAADSRVLVATIKALRILGVLALRRRDAALFRELNVRLLAFLVASRNIEQMTVELANTFAAWLHRIIWSNETFLFKVIADVIFKLAEVKVLTDDGIELIIDELGDVAASACLNPSSLLTNLIMELIFKVADEQKSFRHWINVIRISGRVAKLAIHRHGIVVAFLVVHPLLEFGRNLLWTELKFVESAKEDHRQLLFRVIRESVFLLSYAARQNLLGSTGETIVDVFKCWGGHPNLMTNPKSIKKYCQLLLLFWLKNKRNGKKYMPYGGDFIEPILFSSVERQRLGI